MTTNKKSQWRSAHQQSREGDHDQKKTDCDHLPPSLASDQGVPREHHQKFLSLESPPPPTQLCFFVGGNFFAQEERCQIDIACAHSIRFFSFGRGGAGEGVQSDPNF